MILASPQRFNVLERIGFTAGYETEEIRQEQAMPEYEISEIISEVYKRSFREGQVDFLTDK